MDPKPWQTYLDLPIERLPGSFGSSRSTTSTTRTPHTPRYATRSSPSSTAQAQAQSSFGSASRSSVERGGGERRRNGRKVGREREVEKGVGVSQRGLVKRNSGSRGLPNDAVIHNALCDNCQVRIMGTRFKCRHCPDFDYCSTCFLHHRDHSNQHHPRNHTFKLIHWPPHHAIRPDWLNHPFGALPTYATSLTCHGCDQPIQGHSYKCLTCPDFDLCLMCEHFVDALHEEGHCFVKLRRPMLRPVGVRAPLWPVKLFDRDVMERLRNAECEGCEVMRLVRCAVHGGAGGVGKQGQVRESGEVEEGVTVGKAKKNKEKKKRKKIACRSCPRTMRDDNDDELTSLATMMDMSSIRSSLSSSSSSSSTPQTTDTLHHHHHLPTHPLHSRLTPPSFSASRVPCASTHGSGSTHHIHRNEHIEHIEDDERGDGDGEEEEEDHSSFSVAPNVSELVAAVRAAKELLPAPPPGPSAPSTPILPSAAPAPTTPSSVLSQDLEEERTHLDVTDVYDHAPRPASSSPHDGAATHLLSPTLQRTTATATQCKQHPATAVTAPNSAHTATPPPHPPHPPQPKLHPPTPQSNSNPRSSSSPPNPTHSTTATPQVSTPSSCSSYSCSSAMITGHTMVGPGTSMLLQAGPDILEHHPHHHHHHHPQHEQEKDEPEEEDEDEDNKDEDEFEFVDVDEGGVEYFV